MDDFTDSWTLFLLSTLNGEKLILSRWVAARDGVFLTTLKNAVMIVRDLVLLAPIGGTIGNWYLVGFCCDQWWSIGTTLAIGTNLVVRLDFAFVCWRKMMINRFRLGHVFSCRSHRFPEGRCGSWYVRDGWKGPGKIVCRHRCGLAEFSVDWWSLLHCKIREMAVGQ